MSWTLRVHRDAWNKRKGMSQLEAERLYVEALLQVRRRSSLACEVVLLVARPQADSFLRRRTDPPQLLGPDTGRRALARARTFRDGRAWRSSGYGRKGAEKRCVTCSVLSCAFARDC